MEQEVNYSWMSLDEMLKEEAKVIRNENIFEEI